MCVVGGNVLLHVPRKAGGLSSEQSPCKFHLVPGEAPSKLHSLLISQRIHGEASQLALCSFIAPHIYASITCCKHNLTGAEVERCCHWFLWVLKTPCRQCSLIVVLVPVYQYRAASYSREMWIMAKSDMMWGGDGLILLGLTSCLLYFIPCSCQLLPRTSSWPWGFVSPSMSRFSSLTQQGKIYVCSVLLLSLTAADDQCQQHCGQGRLQRCDISVRVWAAMEGCLRVCRHVPRGVVDPTQDPRIAGWWAAGSLLVLLLLHHCLSVGSPLVLISSSSILSSKDFIWTYQRQLFGST